MHLVSGGPRPIHIDVSGVSTAQDLHARLARGLSFPDWYGHNWDAFEECLVDLPGQVTMILRGGRALQETLTRDLHLLHGVLAEHARQHPHCAVSLVLED